MNCDERLKNNNVNQILDNSHMIQLVKELTNITETSANILDVITTSSLDQIKQTSVRAPSLSNHIGVAVILNLKKKRRSKAKKVFNFARANWRES